MTVQPTGIRRQPRVIRVFVSSTFRDMHAEREELVKRVFPQLRKLCEARGVTWGEVDLRWGVTDEQKAEGKVLPICLAEIQRCRPYFIGLLGQRYGWLPGEIPQELIEQQPWLGEHRTRSVTELEILHGVLNNPAMAGHAFFYFRDPACADGLPPEEEANAEKLRTLKDRIRLSGLPVRENYRDPRELGRLVLEDMTAVIQRLFPEEELDPLDREALVHEAFAESRARVYIGRPEYFQRLDEHARGDGPPLVVLGESGGGKSALLANWALQYREAHAEELVLTHFMGASPDSADWAGMLRRIMGEFRRRLGVEQEVPDKPDALRLAFANALHKAAVRGRVVLVIDALNQLEDREGAPDLAWLPPEIPASVRLVVSTLPGRPLQELERRGWPGLRAEPLDVDERRRFIQEYLDQYRKALSPRQSERIAGAAQAGNPLYLRTLLEELRVYGDHHTLAARIEHYLGAETVETLYERVLERYEQDYEGERPGLVGEALSLLWAARRGLSEAELLALLSAPQAHWAPLCLAAEGGLVNRSGLLGFFHDYLRRAVERRYVAGEEEQRAAHRRLAAYFQAQELGVRKVEELPWQLQQAGDRQRLADLLAEPRFLEAAWERNQFEVREYWAELERGGWALPEAYRVVLEEPCADPFHTGRVATLLADTGHLEGALHLWTSLAEHFRKVGDESILQVSLGNQALILKDRGDLDGAMALMKEQERLCRQLGDPAGLAMSLSNQAAILQTRGDLEGAMALHKEQERLFRQLGDPAGLSASLGNQALILMDRGDLEGAMALMKEQERLCRQLGDPAGLQASLGNQALILKARGDLEGAMALHKEEERLCRQLGDPAGLRRSLGNQAVILKDRGDLEGAMALLKEQERLCRQLGDPNGLRISLGSQALILKDRGDLEGAMALHKEEERLCRQLGDPAGLQVSLGNQALILKARGDLDGAVALLKEQERLCRQLGDPARLSASLGRQAVILIRRGDLDGAMALLKEQERLCRQLGDPAGLSASLGKEALILRARGDLDGAIALLKEQERLCREIENPEELAISLASQAALLGQQRNRPGEALPLFAEAYRIATDHGLAALADQIKPILDSAQSGSRRPSAGVEVGSSTPHPGADPERAARLNIQYRRELARWKLLPWWKRLVVKKPERPPGVWA